MELFSLPSISERSLFIVLAIALLLELFLTFMSKFRFMVLISLFLG